MIVRTMMICALVISSTASAAEYVSPTEYKNYTCEELKEDYSGIRDAILDNFSESIDSLGERKPNQEKIDSIDGKGEILKARETAIEKAAKKINCDLKSSTSSSSSSTN